jgi:RNA polymerase sigma-70 factor (ECF subfamily)
MDGAAKDINQLLPAARAGDSVALGNALENYRHFLLVVALRELDPALQAKAGASDLVQETFLEAQRDFEGFHGTSEEELRVWLRRLLLNNVANFTRRYRDTEKREVRREIPLVPLGRSDMLAGGPLAETPSPSGAAVANEQSLALQEALQRLPDDYRQIILLRYQEQRPFEEIARLLQRSSNAVRKLWARALGRLQKELEAPP